MTSGVARIWCFGVRGHDDRGEVWRGVSAPQLTRGPGGASWAPTAGSWAEPRPLSHFLHILRHRTLLVARKIRFSTLKKWWWQWPPLWKWWWQFTIVTQSCAYELNNKSKPLTLVLHFMINVNQGATNASDLALNLISSSSYKGVLLCRISSKFIMKDFRCCVHKQTDTHIQVKTLEVIWFCKCYLGLMGRCGFVAKSNLLHKTMTDTSS